MVERDDLAQKGLEHLQTAFREVIQATRLLLDAAEELVEDPKAVQDLVGGLAAVANAAAAKVRATPSDDDDPGDGHVERIQVS